MALILHYLLKNWPLMKNENALSRKEHKLWRGGSHFDFIQIFTKWWHWVEHNADFFFLSNYQNSSNFQTFLFVLHFQQRVAKLGAFLINKITFKAYLVQFWSSGYTWLTYFPPPSHCDIYLLENWIIILNLSSWAGDLVLVYSFQPYFQNWQDCFAKISSQDLNAKY